jgi:SAM-dependent methyltransferase
MTPEFDQYSQSYSEDIDKVIGIFGKKHDFFIQAKADIILPALTALDKDISWLKVLDVGCGVGLVHPHLQGRVGALHGAEVSGESLDIARRNNPGVTYDIYDGGVLPYADASFDAAYAIGVMHHVPSEKWPAFLREMRRVVRPGGLVLQIEHNPELLTPWRLRRLMKDAGLTRVWTHYVLFTPFAGKAFRLLDRLLKRVPLGTQYAMGGRA